MMMEPRKDLEGLGIGVDNAVKPQGIYKDLLLILQEVQTSQSEEWEQRPGWEKVACAPVKNHNLAPRDALAILEIFGIMSDRGFDLPATFQFLFDEFTRLRWVEILTHGTG